MDVRAKKEICQQCKSRWQGMDEELWRRLGRIRCKVKTLASKQKVPLDCPFRIEHAMEEK